MNLVFIAFGTRGDVQPAIALARALQAHGHHVRFAASRNFQTWLESHGLEAAPSDVDVQALMEGEGGREWVERGHSPFVQLRLMKRLLERFGPDMMRDAWRAAEGADAIIGSFTSEVYAVSIAEKLRAKYISALFQPALVATRSGAATMNAPLPFRDSWVNYLFGKWIVEPAPWQMYGALANRFRREVLGLPPQTRAQNTSALRRGPVVHGYSVHVVPHPPDWPANFHTTGYWFLDGRRAWTPPKELSAFLEAAAAPIAMGFGSMTGRDPEATSRLLIEAAVQSGRRAVLLSGWGGLGQVELPSTIMRLEAAPHEWLFPRMAAVVHHGGAGTTAASLRAGVPTVVVPHFTDQPFWGRRVEALGVGPRAIPRHKLTVAALAQAIRTATSDPGMKRRAVALGEKLRAEDGVGAAVTLIEQHLER